MSKMALENVDVAASDMQRCSRSNGGGSGAKQNTLDSNQKKDLPRSLTDNNVNPPTIQPLLQVTQMNYPNCKHSGVELAGTDGTLYVEASNSAQPADDLTFRAFYGDSTSGYDVHRLDYNNANTVYMYTIDNTQATSAQQQQQQQQPSHPHECESQKVVTQLKAET